MKKKKFSGDKKVGRGFLTGFENYIQKFTPKIPKFVETYHLTYLTILWSLLIVLGGFLATEDINWLWFVSLMIFFQYITDFYDGKLGKYRKTGLIKWGFYMDHFLDYIFLGAIGLAYAFIIPESSHLFLLFIFVIFGGFMVNSYLSFSASGDFEIHYFKFGPTEARIFFVIINTAIIIFGIKYFIILIPYILGASILALTVIVYRSQRKIWKIDEKEKGSKI